MNWPDATRLAIAVVQIDDVHDLTQLLVERGFGVTRIDAAGGFLRRENAVVMVATDEAGLGLFQSVVRQTCRTRTATWVPAIDDGTVGLYADPVDVEVGGAVLFVLPVERVEYLSGVPNEAVAVDPRRPRG
jgi:uncharacterized protein YaaQ